jgi:RNA polymerase-binding transcription factor DksA
MPSLSPTEFRRFEQRLRERREVLREILRAELMATRRQEYLELAGQVHDIGDESVAELLLGVDLSARQRELDEMRDVEAALERIKGDRFGICTNCEEVIARERLEIYPTAKRCIRCQARHEQRCRGGGDPTPSL